MDKKNDELDDILYDEIIYNQNHDEQEKFIQEEFANEEIDLIAGSDVGSKPDSCIDSRVEELLAKLHDAKLENTKLSGENEIFLKENEILTKNISALYRTATSEIRKLKPQSLKSNKKMGHKSYSRKQGRHRDRLPEN